MGYKLIYKSLWAAFIHFSASESRVPIVQAQTSVRMLPCVYCTVTSTLPGSAALGIVTVSTPSFSFADTLVGSTCLGNQTVRVKLDVPTNDLSDEIWFEDVVLTARVPGTKLSTVNLQREY